MGYHAKNESRLAKNCGLKTHESVKSCIRTHVNVVLSLSLKIIWCRQTDIKSRKNHDRTQELYAHGARKELQQASSPPAPDSRLIRKESARGKRSLFLRGCESARPIRKSGSMPHTGL